MNTEASVLSFLSYQVNNMHFSLKNVFENNNEPIPLSPSFRREISVLNKDQYAVTIEVTLKQDNLPFEAELSLTGHFSYKGEKDVQRILKMNGVAILYPYVRSTLSMMTTIAGIPPVIIPTINLANIFEKEEGNKSTAGSR